MSSNEVKNCVYCGVRLSSKNVFMYSKRKKIVDKCDRCCDKLERGEEMYYGS